jgi:hypothetical protein
VLAGRALAFLMESKGVVGFRYHAAGAGQFRVKVFGAARFMTHLCQGLYGSADVIKASDERNIAASL